MSPRKKQTASEIRDDTAAGKRFEGTPEDEGIPFDQDSLAKMRAVAVSGLNPSSALDLLARLIAEVPLASKQTMDRIKTVDKLISTARSVMETKLKNEEVAALTTRLDEIETRIERLAARGTDRTHQPTEIWNRPDE